MANKESLWPPHPWNGGGPGPPFIYQLSLHHHENFLEKTSGTCAGRGDPAIRGQGNEGERWRGSGRAGRTSWKIAVSGLGDGNTTEGPDLIEKIA